MSQMPKKPTNNEIFLYSDTNFVALFGNCKVFWYCLTLR